MGNKLLNGDVNKMAKEKSNIPHGGLRIKSHLHSLKPSEKKVAEYILENITEIIHYSITRLAKKAGVSEATIVKFCQRIGYSGYQELKIMLAGSVEREKSPEKYIYGEIQPGDNLNTIINKIFQIYDQSLNNTRKLMEITNLSECIGMILKANKIFFFGYGASGIVTNDAELKFKRIKFDAESVSDIHGQKTTAALLTERDLVIAISNSGQTKELVEALEIVRENGAKIIVITSNMGSPVTDFADKVLLTSSKETPFRGSALASRIAQLTIIDVLFLGVAIASYDETLQALEKTRKAMQTSKI